MFSYFCCFENFIFRDIFPILGNPEVFSELNEIIYEASKSMPQVECVVGLESRGFLFGPILAQKLKVPFVPIRKKGKLPGEVVSQTFELEYGTVSLQIISFFFLFRKITDE